MQLDTGLKQHEALHLFMQTNRRLTHVSPAATAGSLHGRRLVNVHIPKTAGITLDRIFDAIATRTGRKCFRALGTVYGQFMGIGKSDAADHLRDADPEELSRAAIFSGHVPALQWEPAIGPRPVAFITMLREPGERMISQYLFGAARGHWRPDAAIEPLVRSGQITDNLQVRMLAGCTDSRVPCDESMLERAYANLQARFSLIGFIDRFDAFVSALLGLHSWPEIIYARYNVTETRLAGARRTALPEEAAGFNAFDAALFARVRRHGDVWINRVDTEAPPTRSGELLVPLSWLGKYLCFPRNRLPELMDIARQTNCVLKTA